MATKRFLIEVKEGRTKCNSFCPLKHNKHCIDVDGYLEDIIPFLRCMEYNLATIKIKTKEEIKKEMLRKAEEWLMKYFVEDHYGMSPAGFGVFFQMFKQAMED